VPNLYDQTVSPGGTTRNDWNGAVGNRFALAADGYLRTVSFWSDNLTGAKPGLNVWSNSGALRLHKAAADVTWVGTATGWITYTLTESESTSVGLITHNTTWEVDLQFTSGGAHFFQGCNTPDNVTDFSYEGARYGGGYPVIADNTAGAPWGISVGVAETAGGDPSEPPPSGATTADLAAWLSNDGATNTHQSDGLPWQTKVDTADIRTKVTNGLNLAGGLQALSDSLANTLQMASDYLAGRTATYFTDLKNRLIGASGGGGSAFYGPDGTQVSAGVEALLARSTNAQVGFPASPWEMTAETDFDGCLAWAQPADLYTVTFATTPPTIPNNGQCGVPVRYRLAWWTSLNGEFAQERHWIDFEKCHLVDPAGRMPGLLLQTYLGGTGHVEAWTLNV